MRTIRVRKAVTRNTRQDCKAGIRTRTPYTWVSPKGHRVEARDLPVMVAAIIADRRHP